MNASRNRSVGSPRSSTSTPGRAIRNVTQLIQMHDMPGSNPFASLRTFARKLGWPRLRRYQHILESENSINERQVITWYESDASKGGRKDFLFQINECPLEQLRTYTVAVYSIRYRICTGWHSMTLTSRLECDDAEVERLEQWVHRRWFATQDDRRSFRLLHPECANYSWKQVREIGTPYEVVDAENCVTKRSTRSRR